MNYLHKISLSHSILFKHYYLNEKIFILISKKCLLINFLFISAISDSETLSAFKHVILVKNKVKLNLMLIRSDIYFFFTDNFFLIFSL